MNLTMQKLGYPIIVHSHLGWDWVWQRPQQFFSRLSARHAILFVEGPTPDDRLETSYLEIRDVPEFPNITVLRMRMPGKRWFDGAWVDAERCKLVKQVLAGPLGLRFEEPVQWFYDPMAVTAFAGKMDERAIVFDCMDQLSQFKGAPESLIKRERELLRIADIVFAGGPKLAKDKKQLNLNTFSYGCGVDVDHFGKASHPQTSVPEEIQKLHQPILGYFGVVDERMDYGLLEALADGLPEANIVMIGPWTKVNPEAFPQRSNLHFLGGRDYELLPAYAKGFDVCLAPFALNEATEYINPTKILEYMATGKPIVSTAIEDVALQFSDVVKIARNKGHFVELCREAILRPDRPAIANGLTRSSQNTWESVVGHLERHIEDFLASGRPARAIGEN